MSRREFRSGLALLAATALAACTAPRASLEPASAPSAHATDAPLRGAVRTDRAPQPIGPYSQAIRAGDTLWVSGQIGLDPVRGQLVPGGIENETRQAIANVRAVLEAADMSLDDVVATQVFLIDLAEFAKFNNVYGEAFASEDFAPARATVGVANLPRGARVEIACTAVRRR
jgi:2-iminobutanoate/2-iminopropanoate deaminase